MKNDSTSRYGIYTLVSLFFYVVCCYIGFSEPWSAGVMKIFMVCILSSAVLFVYFCGKCSSIGTKSQTDDTQNFVLAHSQG